MIQTLGLLQACFVIMIAVVLSACSPSQTIASLTPLRQENRPYESHTITTNNCNGSGTMDHIATRGFTRQATVNLLVNFELGTERQNAIKGALRVQYEREEGQILTAEHEIRLSIAAGTSLTYTINWYEVWQVGEATIEGTNVLVPYEMMTGIYGEVPFSQANPCPQTSNIWSDFIGVWRNEDRNTNSITRVQIDGNSNDLDIQMWGACHPNDCVWRDYSNLEIEYEIRDNTLYVVWHFDFVVRRQELRIISNGRLQVLSHNHFIDDSQRPDYESIDYFSRE